jgi:hypothetical protein
MCSGNQEALEVFPSAVPVRMYASSSSSSCPQVFPLLDRRTGCWERVVVVDASKVSVARRIWHLALALR